MSHTATSAQRLLRDVDRSLHEATHTRAGIEAYLVQVETACRDGFAYVSATSDVTAKRIMLEDLRQDLWTRLERAEEAEES